VTAVAQWVMVIVIIVLVILVVELVVLWSLWWSFCNLNCDFDAYHHSCLVHLVFHACQFSEFLGGVLEAVLIIIIFEEFVVPLLVLVGIVYVKLRLDC
jgi:hypothetical protein